MKILASSLDRCEKCPASARMSAALNNEIPRSFADAARGIALHEACEMILKGKEVVAGYTAKNGEVLTAADMFYVNYAVDLLSHTDIIHAEDWNFCDELESNVCIDAWHYSNGFLNMYDFKFGHTLVEVKDNKQLLTYALVLMKKHRWADLNDVVLHIIQPTSIHPEGRHRMWSVGPQEIQAHVKYLHDRQAAASDPLALAVPGEHCKYAQCRASCSAHTAATYAAVDYAHVPHNPKELECAEIAEMLNTLTEAEIMIKQKITALQAMAVHNIQNGKSVPGYIMEPGNSARFWSVTPDVLESIYGDKVYAPRELISPAQAEKGIIPVKQVEKLVKKVPGKMSLKKRDELAIAQAIFNQPRI